jgi:hypothetical protein
LQSYTAGRVGCPADEIEILDESRDTAARSWTASCRGHVYYCGVTPTPGSVSCTPVTYEAPLRASAQNAAAQLFATSTAPHGGGGFDFATTAYAAEKLCTDSGKTWTARDDGSYECSGALVDLGFAATVHLRSCKSGICEVVLIAPRTGREAADWVKQYADLRNALERKYGTERMLAANPDPGACGGDALKQCLLTGELKAQATWRWRDGTTLTLQMTKASAEAMQIQVVYRDRASMGAPRGSAL